MEAKIARLARAIFYIERPYFLETRIGDQAFIEEQRRKRSIKKSFGSVIRDRASRYLVSARLREPSR
jgi:hypothetical protein